MNHRDTEAQRETQGVPKTNVPPAAVIAKIAPRGTFIKLQAHTRGFGTGKLTRHMPAHLTRDVGIQNDNFIRRHNQKRCKKAP